MDKIGFKRSKDINSHSFYEAQEKNGKNETNVGGQWEKMNVFSVVYLNHAKYFCLYVKQLLSRLRK